MLRFRRFPIRFPIDMWNFSKEYSANESFVFSSSARSATHSAGFLYSSVALLLYSFLYVRGTCYLSLSPLSPYGFSKIIAESSIFCQWLDTNANCVDFLRQLCLRRFFRLKLPLFHQTHTYYIYTYMYGGKYPNTSNYFTALPCKPLNIIQSSKFQSTHSARQWSHSISVSRCLFCSLWPAARLLVP